MWLWMKKGRQGVGEQPRSDGGKDVGEEGSGRAEVSTSMTMVAGGGDNRHQRTRLRIRKRLGHLYNAQYMKDMIGKIRSCSIGWWAMHVMSSLYLPRGTRGNFVFGRRARSPPTRRTKPFADGGKLGTPVKKRSRSISSINRRVTDRIALITTNTNLRSLSFVVSPNSPKLTVGKVPHQPKVPVRGTWNEYSFTSTLLANGGKGARLRTPTPLVSSGQRRCRRSLPCTPRYSDRTPHDHQRIAHTERRLPISPFSNGEPLCWGVC